MKGSSLRVLVRRAIVDGKERDELKHWQKEKQGEEEWVKQQQQQCRHGVMAELVRF
jgi:hypothetical protein